MLECQVIKRKIEVFLSFTFWGRTRTKKRIILLRFKVAVLSVNIRLSIDHMNVNPALKKNVWLKIKLLGVQK